MTDKVISVITFQVEGKLDICSSREMRAQKQGFDELLLLFQREYVPLCAKLLSFTSYYSYYCAMG